MKAVTATPQSPWVRVRVPSLQPFAVRPTKPAVNVPAWAGEAAWRASGVALALGVLHAACVSVCAGWFAGAGASTTESQLLISYDRPAAVLFVAGGLLALTAARPWGTRLWPWVRIGGILLIATLMIARAFVGVTIDVIATLASLLAEPGFRPLILHNPWFIFGGLLLGALGLQLRREAQV